MKARQDEAIVASRVWSIALWQIAAVEHAAVTYTLNARGLLGSIGLKEVHSSLVSPRRRHQPAMAHGGAANALNLLPLSAAQRTWPDLLLARPGRE